MLGITDAMAGGGGKWMLGGRYIRVGGEGIGEVVDLIGIEGEKESN